MNLAMHAKDIFIVTVILGLLTVGLVMALRSGVVEIGRDRGRQVWNNVSQLIVALAGCLAFLLVAEQMAGIRIGLPW